jgi:PBSX family phage terminase large subunit
LKLHLSQQTIVKNKARFRVLLAGRRFGKTVLAIEEMLFIAVTKPDAKIVYIAPTFQSARDIAFEQLKKRTLKIAQNINETRLELDIWNNHNGASKIFLRSWDSVETLRGQAFDFIVMDEVAQYDKFWTGWQEVLRPTLTDKIGKVLFISTPLGFNHFYDLYNTELTDKDYKSFHFTSYDNPFLPKDEIDKAKETLPPDRFAQEYLADFTKTQGLVYKEFSREKHLYDVLPEKPYQKVAGIDFGYRHPAAVLDIRFDGERVYVEDEWYKTERTDIQIAEYVALQKFKEVYPDPENPSAIEELRRKQVNVREVIKGKDSIKSGIQSVREMLIRGTLKVNKRCVNLISEFEMYSYDDTEKMLENPIKANDDALDALRYCISSLLPLVTRKQFLATQIWNYPQKPKTNPGL